MGVCEVHVVKGYTQIPLAKCYLRVRLPPLMDPSMELLLGLASDDSGGSFRFSI